MIPSGRLVRLIPTHPRSTERTAIANLFNHRLSSISSHAASAEWQSLVSGTSKLWSLIPSSKKQLIRSFFNLLNLEILKRSRPPISTFDFTSASVGNLFLTGARIFSGSFESAIYLLGSICGVPDDLVRVIPAINSNFTHHIAAGLADGSVIVGQNSISHPSEATALEIPSSPLSPGSKSRRSRLSLGDPEAIPTDDEAVASADSGHETRFRFETEAEQEEDANLPGSLPTLRKPNIRFSKSYNPTSSSSSANDDLPSRIERVWYINPYGQEISPPPNPRVREAIRSAQAIIYSIGSLYTSIIPSVVLRGVGDAIRKSPAARTKILILNGSLDREVGPSGDPFTALDFVEAIVRAGEESRGLIWSSSREASPPLSRHEDPAAQATILNTSTSTPNQTLKQEPKTKPIHSTYITHLIHLTGPQTPHVDAPLLRQIGIDTLKLYGRKIEEMGPDGKMVVKGLKYDPAALAGAIETILGRKGAAMVNSRDEGGKGGGGGGGGLWDGVGGGIDSGIGTGMGMGVRSRRNTLEG